MATCCSLCDGPGVVMGLKFLCDWGVKEKSGGGGGGGALGKKNKHWEV